MPGKSTALVQQELEIRLKALEANIAELPQMEVTKQKVAVKLTEMKELTVKQVSLTASKQEVTKRLVEVTSDAQKLLTFVDAGIREHYGTRSEKLVEFGRQPFRSQPRLKLVGPDGKPLKPDATPAESPAPPPTE